MYPETDMETFVITNDFLKRIKIPETWEEKSKKLAKIIPKEMVSQVLRSEYLDLFEKFSKVYDPVLVANTLTSIIKDLRRRGINTSNVSEEILDEIFSSVSKKTISKEAIPGVLEIVCKGGVSVKDAVGKSGLKAMSEDDLRTLVRKVFAKYTDMVKEKKCSPLMGEVMKEVRGKIGGDVVSKVLKEELGK